MKRVILWGLPLLFSNLILSTSVRAADTSAKTLETHFKAADVISGKNVEVQIEPGKRALVVTFLSAKCPCSDSHVVALKELHSKFPEMNFIGVHSNVDESPAVTTEYFKKANLPFPVLQDQALHLADVFGAYKTPHAFVLNASGEIVYQGGVSDSKDFAKSKKRFLEEALADIRADQKPRVSEGRTLGCVITRGDEKAPWSQ